MQDQTNQAKQLGELAHAPAREANLPSVSMGFGSLQSFELMQRAAKMLAYSTLVPAAYRVHKELKEYGKVIGYEENPAALPNCVVALNMAQRMGADPLMVMQNLYIVEGRPSWSSQFIIAAINSCGRYSPLRFEMSVLGEPRDVEYTATEWVKNPNGGKDQRREVAKKIRITPRTCVAWAVELATGDRLESPVVSMDMAVAEGWIQKNGSKWQTMPEVMLRYRAAAFFGKLYAPELLMGLQTAEEAQDIIDVTPQADGKHAAVHLGELRDTGAPEAHGQAAAAEDAVDQVQDQQAPEAGQPAAAADTQAGTDQQPAAEAAAPAAAAADPAQAGTKPAALTPELSKAYEGIAVQLNKAGNLDQLAEAADLINTINQPELRQALTGIYRQRMAEFSGGQQDQAKEAAPAAPAKRTRGARTTGSAPE